MLVFFRHFSLRVVAAFFFCSIKFMNKKANRLSATTASKCIQILQWIYKYRGRERNRECKFHIICCSFSNRLLFLYVARCAHCIRARWQAKQLWSILNKCIMCTQHIKNLTFVCCFDIFLFFFRFSRAIFIDGIIALRSAKNRATGIYAIAARHKMENRNESINCRLCHLNWE